MDLDRLILSSDTQLAGIAVVFDMEGLHRGHLALHQDPTSVKMEMRVWQDAYPMRVKHVLICNESPLFDAIYRIVQIWVKDNIRKRVS